MQRYRVQSRPTPELADAWDRYLDAHVPEVVLRGGFAGGELAVDAEGLRTSDYLAPEGVLSAYLANAAPALRADAEAKFPTGIQRFRETSDVRARVSPALSWDALGLVDEAGRPVPAPADGPFTLVAFAHWCDDCRSAFPELLERVRANPGRSALVGVYANPEENRDFARSHGATETLWFEPGHKDDATRLRSAHAWLRTLSGDARRWGVPAIRSLYLHSGRCVLVTA